MITRTLAKTLFWDNNSHWLADATKSMSLVNLPRVQFAKLFVTVTFRNTRKTFTTFYPTTDEHNYTFFDKFWTNTSLSLRAIQSLYVLLSSQQTKHGSTQERPWLTPRLDKLTTIDSWSYHCSNGYSNATPSSTSIHSATTITNPTSIYHPTAITTSTIITTSYDERDKITR